MTQLPEVWDLTDADLVFADLTGADLTSVTSATWTSATWTSPVPAASREARRPRRCPHRPRRAAKR
ncbi:MAG: hypothetical protein LC700_03385, partial [Actinobacteria bacterium]|nr:hypothetical protein [Actinomycetota bacterium]